MISRKKSLFFIMVVFLLVIAGCDSDSTPGVLTSGSSGDAIDESGGDSSSGEADLGSAQLVYDYSIEDPRAKVNVQAVIPVTIERDPDNPGKYLVNGFNQITVTQQIRGGSSAVGYCWLKCEYPVVYYATGNLTQDYEVGCKISQTFSGEFDTENINKTSDCPVELVSPIDCVGFIVSFADDHTYQFTKEKPYDSPPPSPNDSRTRRAEIKNVKMPQSLLFTCEWGK